MRCLPSEDQVLVERIRTEIFPDLFDARRQEQHPVGCEDRPERLRQGHCQHLNFRSGNEKKRRPMMETDWWHQSQTTWVYPPSLRSVRGQDHGLDID